jgi:hypothetical protein
MANETLSGLQGFMGGMGTGSAMGTMLGGPGVGTVVGALLGGTIGAFAGADKAKNLNEATAKFNAIPEVDPNQLMFKDQLLREKRAVESGFSTDFQVARDIIGESEAGGMSVAAEMAKTNPALALMTMDQIGKGTDTSVNKALGTIGARGMQYTSIIGDLINQMAQRKLNVNIMKASQGMATATKGMQDFNANANAGMMELLNPSVMNGFKGLFNKAGVGDGTVSMSGFTTDPAVLAGLQ